MALGGEAVDNPFDVSADGGISDSENQLAWDYVGAALLQIAKQK